MRLYSYEEVKNWDHLRPRRARLFKAAAKVVSVGTSHIALGRSPSLKFVEEWREMLGKMKAPGQPPAHHTAFNQRKLARLKEKLDRLPRPAQSTGEGL